VRRGSPPPVAIVFIEGERREFVADACVIECGVVTASGRWRQWVGPTHERVAHDSAAVRRSWSRHRWREVRWLDEQRARDAA
jgi:hypothetical protein